MVKNFLFITFLLFFFQAQSAHRVRFDLKELEWNGVLKKYGTLKRIEVYFELNSGPQLLDSFPGNALYVKFIYVPVYSDKGNEPGFYADVYDRNSSFPPLRLKTIYEEKKYDAGIKEKDKDGTRRWAGELRYFPDTSIKSIKPAWRSDHFTLMIDHFQAWKNVKVGNKKTIKGKNLHRLYFEGQTGKLSEPKNAGKFKKERITLVMDPVRYKWGDEVWIMIHLRLYLTQKDGKKIEILAQPFDSRNKDIQYGEVVKVNAYERLDKHGVYHMLTRGIYIIPY